MGVDVVWQDERGNEIERLGDPSGRLALFLLVVPLDHSKCLGFIDPYGDTYFNQQQIHELLKEIQETEPTITDEAILNYYREKIRRAKEARWQESVIAQLEEQQGKSQAESIFGPLQIWQGAALTIPILIFTALEIRECHLTKPFSGRGGGFCQVR